MQMYFFKHRVNISIAQYMYLSFDFLLISDKNKWITHVSRKWYWVFHLLKLGVETKLTEFPYQVWQSSLLRFTYHHEQATDARHGWSPLWPLPLSPTWYGRSEDTTMHSHTLSTVYGVWYTTHWWHRMYSMQVGVLINYKHITYIYMVLLNHKSNISNSHV